MVLIDQMRQLFASTSSNIERLVGGTISPKDLSELLPESVIQRIKKIVGIKKFSPGILSELERLVQTAKKSQHGILQDQLKAEIVLSELVADAYGLTAQEKELMRATRPPRDPLDVLEARLQGREISNPEDMEGE